MSSDLAGTREAFSLYLQDFECESCLQKQKKVPSVQKQSFEFILNHWITTLKEEVRRGRCPAIKRLKVDK